MVAPNHNHNHIILVLPIDPIKSAAVDMEFVAAPRHPVEFGGAQETVSGTDTVAGVLHALAGFANPAL